MTHQQDAVKTVFKNGTLHTSLEVLTAVRLALDNEGVRYDPSALETAVRAWLELQRLLNEDVMKKPTGVIAKK